MLLVALAGCRPSSSLDCEPGRTAMALEAGDVVTIALFDPDGRVAASNTEPSLPRAKAVHLLVSGVRNRGAGRAPGPGASATR